MKEYKKDTLVAINKCIENGAHSSNYETSTYHNTLAIAYGIRFLVANSEVNSKKKVKK